MIKKYQLPSEPINYWGLPDTSSIEISPYYKLLKDLKQVKKKSTSDKVKDKVKTTVNTVTNIGNAIVSDPLNTIGYITPGTSTVLLARDAGNDFIESYKNLKKGNYLNSFLDASRGIANTTFGVVSLLPFTDKLINGFKTATKYVPYTKNYSNKNFKKLNNSNLTIDNSKLYKSLGKEYKPNLTSNLDPRILEVPDQVVLQELKSAGYDIAGLTEDDLMELRFMLLDLVINKVGNNERAIIKIDDNYHLINGNRDEGLLQVELNPDGTYTPMWIENLTKKYESELGTIKGVSTMLYDGAIRDGLKLKAGAMLTDPKATLKIYDKYSTKKLIGNYGTLLFENSQITNGPVYILDLVSEGSLKLPITHFNWLDLTYNGIPNLVWKKQGGQINYLKFFK